MYYKKFLSEVQRGKLGLNNGLPMGLPQLGKEIDEVQRATFYLIGGETGTGKTAFVDQCFILEPILHILNNPSEQLTIKIFYESLEIDIARKIAKWTSYILHTKEDITTSMRELLSKGDNEIPEDVEKLLPEYQEIMDKIFSFVELSDQKINPTGIAKKVSKYMDDNGRTEVVELLDNKGNKYKTDVYVPNNPNEIVVLVVDHIGLLRKEQGFTKKENIDKLSEYCVELRNKYGISPVLLSQFNRSLADIDRQRFKEVQPQLSDFKDSGNTQEDANVVLALFNPIRYNITTYAKYNIGVLNPRYRAVNLLKTRDGEDMMRFSLNFLGECGKFRHLPKPDRMRNEDYIAAKEFTQFINK